MKNPDKWLPTKFSVRRGRLRGSRNRKYLHIASRLIGDRVAACYESMIKDHVRGDLLDLGCGQVPFYAAYRSFTSSVTCIDWPGSPHDVQFADILCDINQSLPIPDESFDTIICSDVLEHLHNPNGLLSEIRRVLRPGGKVLLNVPFMYGLHEEPFDFHRYTRHAITHLSDTHGLEVLELKTLGGAGDVACDLFSKLSSNVPVVGDAVALMLQSSWKLATRIGFVRRLDERSANHFPYAYFALLTDRSRGRR